MKNPLKKEYLNLYKEREGGGYVFTGVYYAYQGGNFKKSFAILASQIALIGALIVASGCLNAGGMKNSFYVIFPYIGEASAFFALAWSSMKLLIKGERVKEYIYTTTYPRIPHIALALAVLCAVSLVCSLVFIVLNGAEGGAVKCAVYLALKAVIAALALLFRHCFKRTEYRAEK